MRPTLLMWLILLGFGLSFGLNYGIDNHVFYLLPALERLHPELWQNDWVVTQTHHYHVTFSALARAMLTLDPSGWSMGIANVVAVAVGFGCIWGILRQLLSAERARLALLILLVIATGTRTWTAGTAYVFSIVFQPSTIGTLGVLAASWLLSVGRPLWSGLALLAGCFFHANYLVLCGPVFLVAQLAQGRQDLLLRCLKQLAPLALAVPPFLPLLLATSSAPVLAEAQRVYQDVRSPHHYRVEGFALELLPSLGWQLLGVGNAWLMFRGRPVFQRLLGLLAGFWVLIVPCMLVCGLLVFRPLIQLYPWRLIPNCEILAQALFTAAMVERTLSADTAPKRRAGEVLLASLLGLALVGYGGIVGKQMLPFVAGASALAVAELSDKLRQNPLAIRARALLPYAWLLALVAANVPRFSRLERDSSLLGGQDHGVNQLCGWLAKNTVVGSLLLTPPDDEDIRFRCQRATIVDWKTAPMVPSEVLVWQRRMEDVTGRRPLRSTSDMAGYAQLDESRLTALRATYRFDYVVARSERPLAIGLEPAFRGERFVVYRLPDSHVPAPQ